MHRPKLTREEQGWIKPKRQPTRAELLERVVALRKEANALERQVLEMDRSARLEALVRIRNLMRGFEISIEEIAPRRRRGRPRRALESAA